MTEALKLAYADPPYLGQCVKYGHRHEPPYGCWDENRTHRNLLRHLHENYDGWAYSLSSTSLAHIVGELRANYTANVGPHPSTVRIGAWTKTFCAHKANVRMAYSWEPVLFVPGRDRSADGAAVGHDSLVEPITLQRGLVGAKSERFCRWVLDLLGYIDGDYLDDIFPGSGVMCRVLAQGRLTI